MPALVQEAGWCPGCNSRLRASGEESRLGGSRVYEAGLSLPTGEGTLVAGKILRSHGCSDKKQDQVT